MTPWTAAHQASLSVTISRSLPKFISIASSHLILCYLLCLLPSIFPSIRVTIKNTQKPKIQNLGLFDSKWLKNSKTLFFTWWHKEWFLIGYLENAAKHSGENYSHLYFATPRAYLGFIFFQDIIFFIVGGGLVAKSCSTHCKPMGCSPRLLCLWDFPGKGTGLSCPFLLWGIFLTEGSNLGLLHCRQPHALL